MLIGVQYHIDGNLLNAGTVLKLITAPIVYLLTLSLSSPILVPSLLFDFLFLS